MKPIEIGCLAVVVGVGKAENAWVIGRTVRVIDRAEDGDVYRGKVNDFDAPWAWVAEGLADGPSFHLPQHLVRIDGGAESEERIAERKDMEVPA